MGGHGGVGSRGEGRLVCCVGGLGEVEGEG